MIEFGLETELEKIDLLNELVELDRSLGEFYDTFFDNSYEMASNPSNCLVQKREATREAAFRRACDEYLMDNRNTDLLKIVDRKLALGSIASGWFNGAEDIRDYNLEKLMANIEKCKAV